MNAMTLDYRDFSPAALIQIFQLADILDVTPREAATAFLKLVAEKETKEVAA